MKHIKLFEEFIKEGFFDKIFGKKERYVDTSTPRSQEPIIDDSKNNSEQLKKEVEGFIKESNDIISKGKSNEFLFYINPLKYENTQFVEIVDKIKKSNKLFETILNDVKYDSLYPIFFDNAPTSDYSKTITDSKVFIEIETFINDVREEKIRSFMSTTIKDYDTRWTEEKLKEYFKKNKEFLDTNRELMFYSFDTDLKKILEDTKYYIGKINKDYDEFQKVVEVFRSIEEKYSDIPYKEVILGKYNILTLKDLNLPDSPYVYQGSIIQGLDNPEILKKSFDMKKQVGGYGIYTTTNIEGAIQYAMLRTNQFGSGPGADQKFITQGFFPSVYKMELDESVKFLQNDDTHIDETEQKQFIKLGLTGYISRGEVAGGRTVEISIMEQKYIRSCVRISNDEILKKISNNSINKFNELLAASREFVAS